MDYIGIIKVFDSLGMIVIPKELKARYGITQRVEMIATKDGILLRNPDFVLVKKEETDG